LLKICAQTAHNGDRRFRKTTVFSGVTRYAAAPHTSTPRTFYYGSSAARRLLFSANVADAQQEEYPRDAIRAILKAAPRSGAHYWCLSADVSGISNGIQQ
jgi:hypothetical protein